MTSLFPMFVKLAGRQCLVVGAGKVGEPKIGGLIEAGVRIRVVAREVSSQVRAWAGRIDLRIRSFTSNDLDGVFLAVIATATHELNKLAHQEAQLRAVLCNVVDVPDCCDFFYPDLVRRGALQIAISPTGRTPSLAQQLRKELEQQLRPEYQSWVKELGSVRKSVLASSLDRERKLDLLRTLASRADVDAALAGRANSQTKGKRQ